MKRVTADFMSTLIDEAIIEYTKNRFISDSEVEELKVAFLAAADLRITKEVIGAGEINLNFDIL